MIRADACRLPYRAATFDMVFTSPPWDNLAVLAAARPELERVLSRRGLMVLVLPGHDRESATLAVTNRDWSQRQTFVCERPSLRVGPSYFSMSDGFVRSVFGKYRPRRVLDPFAGVGTVPRVARSMGVWAVGSDLSTF